MSDFGSYLRKLRKSKGMTLNEVSDITGYSQPYLSQIETGSHKNISIELLTGLSRAYCINISTMAKKAGLDFFDEYVQAPPQLTMGIGCDGTSYQEALLIDELIELFRRNKLTINQSNMIMDKVKHCLGNTPL